MRTIQDIKDKLKKLIAKEESARKIGNLQEAEAFASHIQKLFIAYELDIAELKNNAEETQVGDEMFDVSELTGGHESNWVCYLYNACAKSNFCEVIFNKGNQYQVFIFGTSMNRELLHFMVAQLVIKLRTLARKAFSEYEGPDKRNTFIRSFLKGAAAGIRTRLALDRMAEQKNTDGVAALVVQKDRAVTMYLDKYMGDRGLKVKGHKGRATSSADGYAEGLEAGKNVSINKGMEASTKKPLLLN